MTVTHGAYGAADGGALLESVDGSVKRNGDGAGAGPEVRSVAVVGLGYVGLPTALAFAASGIGVAGIDTSPARLSAIHSRHVDLMPSDRTRLDEALGKPDFILTADTSTLTRADAIIVCVPTPVDSHFAPDLRSLSDACSTVVKHARAGQTLILTSTTYVGTTRELLVHPLAERGLVAGRDVFLAFSPERIDPGNALHPLQTVPRIVGGVTPSCAAHARAVIRRTCSDVHLVSSPEAAEMTKLSENIFRAVNIALANEMSDIAHALDIDPREVIEAASTKPYGFMAFHPGPGVGGHCVPCDPHYLRWQLRSLREESPLIDEAMACIARRPRRVVRRIVDVLSERGVPLRRARILVYGISYKAGVRDTRESPAIDIIEELIAKGAQVAYYDQLVRSVQVRGREMCSRASAEGEWDLVLAHTVHSEADVEWLARCSTVLDASYRLPHAAGIETV